MRTPANLLWAVLLVLFALTAALETAPASPATTAPAWDDCLGCHTDATAGLPELTTFRVRGLGQRLPGCLDCHEPLDLTGVRSNWTHPVRSVASHLACTDCHQAVPHDETSPPPLPQGDYKAEGCYVCHREVEAKRLAMWSHGHLPSLECRTCHPAHEPLRAALPLDLMSLAEQGGWLDMYDWWQSNRLCFQCHIPAELILPLDQGFVTLNTVNYHDLHVNQGRVLCVECHDPHGSNRRGMLRDQLLDGRLLGFFDRVDGGSCAVTCHGIEHDDWRYINEVF